MKEEKIELIAVFKKEVSEEAAQAVLNEFGVAYRQGMDSSRGKIYFYSTGPKFILTFASERERKKFVSGIKRREEIYELYIPDWGKRKD